MIVALLAVLTVVLAVAGAEFVRSTCRRQLMAPVGARPQVRGGAVDQL